MRTSLVGRAMGVMSRYLVRSLVVLACAGALMVASAAWWRVDRALQVSTGLTAKTLCSAVFVSGLNPEDVFRETVKPMIGLGLVSNRIRYTVDAARREVRADWSGLFQARSLDRGPAGCQLVGLDAIAHPTPLLTPFPTPSPQSDAIRIVQARPSSPALDAALLRAFAEPLDGPARQLKAVVVVKDGVLVGEHYAPGVTPNTPLMGFSLTKTVINALTGILVRERRVRVSDPAPVAAWRGGGDPRRRITIDQLLRMTSGLAAEESHSGFDFTSRMLFVEWDMARFAEQAKLKHAPGTVWEYQSPNTLVLSRIIKDAVGGGEGDVLNFARGELFAKLGSTTAVLETDAAGTPVGSQGMLASARDWARLGQLYLSDGVVNGTRVLPKGWVTYSATPTLGTTYGAGIWTNRSRDQGRQARLTRAGMPADAFYASGNLGQRIYVIPSKRIVIVRMGNTHMQGNDLAGDMKLVRAILAATNNEPAAA